MTGETTAVFHRALQEAVRLLNEDATTKDEILKRILVNLIQLINFYDNLYGTGKG